jgi:Protein of unknown function (DUF2950)
MVTVRTDVSHKRAPFLKTIAALAAATIPSTAMGFGADAQERFKTPEAAAVALVNAAKAENRDAILKVLGRGASDIISSGDPVADASTRQRFVSAYDTKHQISLEGDSKAILIIGQEDFPFPIPLVRSKSRWHFDTAAGRNEILYRRIGRNELDTIQTCLAYVDAQNEYADKDRTGAGPGVYAQRIVSDPGTKDGLYWPNTQGTGESPLGKFIAEATAQGYRVGGGRTPYHGYYYKILTKQGPAASGGALDYIVDGKMIGGFALVAYPAEYRNSGVMTFIVNHAGSVYQKDLGPHTATRAERMTSFDPDKTWRKVSDTKPGK